ncbi:hypothetical protein H0I25_18620 [Cellulophaga sp. HaHa_2_95]|uniref:hypothetical protein n=1 Tax=Cellulophaga sp. HaHa_2_95 TaxID=2745558 RepID=UPI001C4FB063|nr:hypothetical protein [Cellulophaga sp. HaHa_2_95]QXP56045.1 hypothetical protein H0I25_18620 [Cellulophaga sp. HaHa_2_95]
MAERLVIVSDMWGTKRGQWITSYLGYLQQHFDIVFYDCQELANINLVVENQESLHHEFVHGGIETAVAHLLKRETIPSHYLAFSTGGTIVYKAGLQGLSVKSLHAISPTRVRFEKMKPNFPFKLVFGANDQYRPEKEWGDNLDISVTEASGFGHELYSDEKIIKQVCLELLDKVIKKQFQD